MSLASFRIPLQTPATEARRHAFPARRSDRLSPGAQRAVIAAVVIGHLAAAFGLLHVGAVREAVRDAAPIFAGLIAPDAPRDVPPPAPAPRLSPVAPPPIIAAPPAPAEAPPEFEVAAPPADSVVVAAAPPAPAPAVAAAPSPQPRTLPATDVGYLEPPRLVYPPSSRRAGEEGRVLLRVLVNPAGLPAQVLLSESSGYARLDDAAAAAARRARFRPYTEDGIAQTVWVLLPIVFILEQRP